MKQHFKIKLFTRKKSDIQEQQSVYNSDLLFSEIVTNNSYNLSKHPEQIFVNGEFTPISTFKCNLYQEPISSGLVQSDTIVVLGEYIDFEDITNEDGSVTVIPKSTIAPIPEIPQYEKHIEDGWKILLYIDQSDQSDLKFFTVDKNNDEVKWTDRLLLNMPIKNGRNDMSYHEELQNSIAFCIGFQGDKDGQYENQIHFCEIKTSENDPNNLTGLEDIVYCGVINVMSSVIGEDERYRSLFENFGIPDPISYMDVFKKETKLDAERSKYENNIDYETLNNYSKQLFLSYDRIFPYCGTYRGLINAVDYLGYNDILFKEWYKELPKDNKEKANLVAYNISYKSSSNGNMLSDLPIERRIALKKTNWLSMIYKITETIDNSFTNVQQKTMSGANYTVNGTEVTIRTFDIQENYSAYESIEILQQLISLKNWLERNIIALNCRIIDINGEGITYEYLKYPIYGKTIEGMEMFVEKTVSPYLYDYNGSIPLFGTYLTSGKDHVVENNENKNIRVRSGIRLPQAVVTQQKIKKIGANIKVGLTEFDKAIELDNELESGIKEASKKHPYKTALKETYKTFSVKAYMSSKSGVIPCGATYTGKKEDLLGNNIDAILPILIQDGEIFFDPQTVINEDTDLTAYFCDTPIIKLERATIRDPRKVWDESVLYTISNDNDDEYSYKIKDKDGNIIASKNDYITLTNSIVELEKLNHINIHCVDRETSEKEPTSTSTPLMYTANNHHGVPMFMISTVNSTYEIEKDGTQQEEKYTTLAYQDYDKTFRKVSDDGEYVYNQDFVFDKSADNKTLILDIMDGKFIFTDTYEDEYNDTVIKTTTLNFHYDDNEREQTIEINYEYEKSETVENILSKNEPCLCLTVKNIGEYEIFTYITDQFNNLYGTKCTENASVIMPTPYMRIYSNNNTSNNTPDFYNVNITNDKTVEKSLINSFENQFSIDNMCCFKEQYLISNISLKEDENDNKIAFTYPTISYVYDAPKQDDIIHIMSMTDKFDVVGSIEIGSGSKTPGEGEIGITLKRIGNFRSQTFSEIPTTYESENLNDVDSHLWDVNLIIYDNLHSIPVFQQTTQMVCMENNNGDCTYKVILPSDAMPDIAVLYDSSALTQYNVWNTPSGVIEDIDKYGSKGNKKVLAWDISTPLDIKNMHNVSSRSEGFKTDVDDIDPYDAFSTNKLFTLYVQAFYSLNVEECVNDENNKTTTLTIKGSYSGHNVFTEGQLIKIGSSLMIGENEIQSVGTTRVIDSSVYCIQDASTNIYVENITIDGIYKKSEAENAKTFVSRANQVFTDYTSIVKDAYESVVDDINTSTTFIEDTNILNYIDNTFSVSSREFDVTNAYDMWMNNINVKDSYGNITVYPTITKELVVDSSTQTSELVDKNVYVFEIPITIGVGEDLVITGHRENVWNTKQYNYWKVKIYDPTKDKFTLLFESWNNTLFITPSKEGIYSIELFVYDLNGNLTSTERTGAFKVIKKE